jgi:biopolymer transport protein ExbD
MNFSNNDDVQHEFQIAPMIDIVFLLLVFFVVSYAMAQMERELAINLPESEKASASTSRINQIVVNVSVSGEVIVNKRKMSCSQLEERLERIASFGDAPAVIIRADADCRHRYVVRVMDTCAKAKVKQILFSTNGKEEKGEKVDS